MMIVLFFFQKVHETFRGKGIYLETRNLFDYSNYRNFIQRAGWIYESHLNFQLSLKGLSKESLLSVFDNNIRRRIKNSISEGAAYKECKSDIEINGLYNILNDLYKKKVKLPLPDLKFFKDFFNSGLMKIFIVEHNGNIIGGSFCPYDKDGIYTYYYCDLRDYNKRISPTHLSIYAAMEYAIENNIPRFDFMGAGKPGVPFGVRNFKKQFGGELVEHGRFVKILDPFLFKIGKFGIKVLSKFS